jgi:lysyl-tRNA synthetase, class II
VTDEPPTTDDPSHGQSHHPSHDPSHDQGDDADLPEQLRIRREKRQRVLDSGRQAYPVTVPRTHTLSAVRAGHPELAPGTETDDLVGVAGRVVFVRNTGKLCFATLQEGDGSRLQAMLSLDGVGAESLATTCSCTAG